MLFLDGRRDGGEGVVTVGLAQKRLAKVGRGQSRSWPMWEKRLAKVGRGQSRSRAFADTLSTKTKTPHTPKNPEACRSGTHYNQFLQGTRPKVSELFYQEWDKTRKVLLLFKKEVEP